MGEFIDSLQFATAVWTVGFVLAALVGYPAIRKSVFALLGRFANRAVLTMVGIVVAFTALAIWLLKAAGIWEIRLGLETVVWLLGAMAIVVRSAERQTNRDFLRDYLRRHVKVVGVVETVVVAQVAAPLWALIILVPVATCFGLLEVMARDRKAREAVGCAVAALGLGLLGMALGNVIQDPSGLFNELTLRRAILPPLLSLLFVPVAFGFEVFFAYEAMFLALRAGRAKPPALVRRAKWLLFWHFGPRPRTVRRASQEWHGPLLRLESEEELRALLASG